MKILFIDQYNTIGGGQTVLIQLINISLEKNWEVSLMIPPGGELKSQISSKVKIIPLHGLNLKQKKGLRDYLQLILFTFLFFQYYKVLKNNNLVYVNGPRCFIPVAFVSIFLRTRIIYHIHLLHKGVEKKIISYISKLKNTFRIVVNSEFIYQVQEPTVSRGKLYLLENTLPEKYNKLSFINRFNSEKLNFTIIGRVSEEKGQHLLPSIARQFPDYKFYIIGDKDFASAGYFEKLKEEAPSNMIFCGKSGNIIETINTLRIHISLIPSMVEESFGLVAVESMACSCLTIVSEKGGLSEIAQRTNAITFTSSHDLMHQIRKIANESKEKLAELALQQFTLTKNHYNFEKFRSCFIKLVDQANG